MKFILLLLICFSSWAHAGQVVQFTWDPAAEGAAPAGYHLYSNGALVDTVTDGLVGQHEFEPGSYVITVSAFAVDGDGAEIESELSEPYALNVPGSPVNVRISVVVDVTIE